MSSMQQFTVPQFIDVEDKIIGPITTRQFLIILGGCMLIAFGYKFFDFALFVTSGIFILVVIGVLAFVKINGMPFHFFILNFLQTFSRPGLRVWNNNIGRIQTVFDTESAPPPAPAAAPAGIFGMSRLAELSLIVDTSGSYRGEESAGLTDIRIDRLPGPGKEGENRAAAAAAEKNKPLNLSEIYDQREEEQSGKE